MEEGPVAHPRPCASGQETCLPTPAFPLCSPPPPAAPNCTISAPLHSSSHVTDLLFVDRPWAWGGKSCLGEGLGEESGERDPTPEGGTSFLSPTLSIYRTPSEAGGSTASCEEAAPGFFKKNKTGLLTPGLVVLHFALLLGVTQ